MTLDPPHLAGDRLEIKAHRAAFRDLTLDTERLDLLAALLHEMQRQQPRALEALGRGTRFKRRLPDGQQHGVVEEGSPGVCGRGGSDAGGGVTAQRGAVVRRLATLRRSVAAGGRFCEASLTSARRPQHGAAAQQMQMQVRHCLARLLAAVEHQSVAVLQPQLPRQPRRHQMQMAEQLAILLGDGCP